MPAADLDLEVDVAEPDIDDADLAGFWHAGVTRFSPPYC